MFEFRLPKLDGGLNLRDLEYKIEDNQSPSMLNMWYNDRVLSKRWGQEYAIESLDGEVHAISVKYSSFVCVHAGTKLYKWDVANETVTAKQSSVQDQKGAFIEFNSVLYYFDGAEIYQIASDYTVTTVDPRVPITFISATPTLSESTANDAFNLIGAGYKVTYDGDGASTSYTLPSIPLDATLIEVDVSGATVVETVGFTANHTTGVLDFTAGTSPYGAPASGTNNVTITGFRTISGSKNKIVTCKTAIAYGGESSGVGGGSRVFVMRNSTYPLTYWKSDLGASQSYGMTYFPDDQEELLDSNSDDITGAGKQLGELIIFKTNSIFALLYEFDGTDVYFATREVNSFVGCDMPYSIQLIDNHLVFFNTATGGYMLVGTANYAEDNIKPISGNIDGTTISFGFLGEPLANRQDATSFDYEQKYWLCVGKRVYLWDYGTTAFYSYSNYEKAQRRLAWYKLDNINANAFYGGIDLYYGDRTTSTITKFITSYRDYDEPINAYWTSKLFDMRLPNYEKTFDKIHVSIRPDTNTQISVDVIN